MVSDSNVALRKSMSVPPNNVYVEMFLRARNRPLRVVPEKIETTVSVPIVEPDATIGPVG